MAKKVYIECPEFIQSTKENKIFKEIVLEKFDEIKKGSYVININFKKIDEKINGKTFNKWIELRGDEVTKWEEIREYAKSIGIGLKAFVLLIIYNEILKE